MPLSPMKRLPSGIGRRRGVVDALSASNSSELKTRPGDRNSLPAGRIIPPGPIIPIRPPPGAPAGPAPGAAPGAPAAAMPRPPPLPPAPGMLGGSRSHSPSGTPGIFGFSFRPSYQNTFNAGMSPYAAKSYRMTEPLGNMKGLTPSFLMHSTLTTFRLERWSAMFGAPRMWHAISPRAPQPK